MYMKTRESSLLSILLAYCCIQGTIAADYGESCDATADCDSEKDLACLRPLLPLTIQQGCTNKLCLCPGTQQYKSDMADSPVTKCREVKQVGATCTTEEAYKCPMGSVCTQEGEGYICKCPASTNPKSDNSGCLPECSSDYKCGYNAGPCEGNSECRDSNGLVCDSASNKCKCKAGYRYVDWADFCEPDPDKTNCASQGETCIGLSYPLARTCNADLKCACPTKYKLHPEHKICVPDLEYQCSSENTCLGDMTCNDGTCACPDDQTFTILSTTYCTEATITTVTEGQCSAPYGSASPPYKVCGSGLVCMECGGVTQCVPAPSTAVHLVPCVFAILSAISSVLLLC